jgi:diguanylate cyclase (GGDEF)-like protein
MSPFRLGLWPTVPIVRSMETATFNERLQQADGSRDQVTLLLVDVDNFRELNRTRGRAVGDGLLVEIGRGISSALGPKDAVARVGGDEFGVLLTSCNGSEADTAA